MLKNLILASAVALASTAAVEAAPVDVDIVFVIDQSGSMSNEFSTLGSNISTFVSGLAGDANVSSVNAGLVTYEEARLGPTGNCGFGNSCLQVSQALTSDVTTLGNALAAEASQTFGGTEDALAAVDSVLPGGSLFTTVGWRANTVKSIVLITDEDADDESSYTNSFGTGYAALGQKLDSVNYLNNIITITSLFSEYEPASRPNDSLNQALFDLNSFTGAGADPAAFLAQFAAAKLQEITTGGVPTGGSTNVVPLPASGWLVMAGLGALFAARRRKSAA
ncbi:VPLPA-CTERM sorting domain-containing protein [Phaeobacter sp. 22II1-1F12B]|uniref:VPLPA-CTERM sorting domain-containing protein n=1 Tax=Phaeobacter sp. 22II1-1F12B TaxID=1317111 RepID=UPI000B52905A|nr:VPLPA-CTERM sorting domain-containing protein [Phaeobacter sp. 22II1-1F12B]OWU82424.1 hypothetical protein ATO1_00365 [Phaeobacter sp. 22II1-1F12B]